MTEILPEVLEPLDEGWISEDDLRDPVFTNPVRFSTDTNPDFFDYADAVRTPEGWCVARLRLEEQTWKPEAYAGTPKPDMKRGGREAEGQP